MKDLFFDSPVPHGHRPTPKPAKIDRDALAFRYELAALDLRLRASRIIEAGKRVNAATLDNDELDQALGYVVRAYADNERAEVFEATADTLRERDFSERKSRERQTCVA